MLFLKAADLDPDAMKFVLELCISIYKCFVQKGLKRRPKLEVFGTDRRTGGFEIKDVQNLMNIRCILL